jgi:hypothetical protein
MIRIQRRNTEIRQAFEQIHGLARNYIKMELLQNLRKAGLYVKLKPDAWGFLLDLALYKRNPKEAMYTLSPVTITQFERLLQLSVSEMVLPMEDCYEEL